MNTNDEIKNKISNINIINKNLQDRLNNINNLYNIINNDNTMMEKEIQSNLSLIYIKKLSDGLLYIKITLFIITILSISFFFFVIFRTYKKENK